MLLFSAMCVNLAYLMLLDIEERLMAFLCLAFYLFQGVIYLVYSRTNVLHVFIDLL